MADKTKKITITDESDGVEEHVDKMLQLPGDDSKSPLVDEQPVAELMKTRRNETTAVEAALSKDEADLNQKLLADSPSANLLKSPEPLNDDTDLDPIISDIVSNDGDELLRSRDEKIAELERLSEASKKKRRGPAALLRDWWRNKPARYITLAVITIILIAAGMFAPTRYAAMNSVGIRSAASLTIIDSATQLPLKNVSVEIGDSKAKANQDGEVKLHGLKLGTQSLSISQSGFASINNTITLGLGSNPLGDYKLEAVGTQFRFILTDYVSGKPLADAEVDSQESSAKSDTKGRVVLTLDSGDTADRQATISATGYKSQKVDLETGAKQNQSLVMVPEGSDIYVSKQSGKYDVYSIGIDGTGRKLLLAGTGREDEDISVVANHDGDEVAVVSKRDTLTNQDGYVLQSLSLVNTETGSALTLEHSERIRIIGWSDDKVVYIRIKAGTSAGNAERYQLVSYDYKTNSRLQLASANYFTDMLMDGSTIYYAASNGYVGSAASQVVRINADNTSKKVILDKIEVYNLSRDTYETLRLSTADGLYAMKIGDTTAAKLSDSQDTQTDRYYADSPDGKHSAWIDARDGKGVLISYDIAAKKDTVVFRAEGVTTPVRWLNTTTMIYRVFKQGESADYIVSLSGGEPKKITDLTNTSGLQAWHYL